MITTANQFTSVTRNIITNNVHLREGSHEAHECLIDMNKRRWRFVSIGQG